MTEPLAGPTTPGVSLRTSDRRGNRLARKPAVRVWAFTVVLAALAGLAWLGPVRWLEPTTVSTIPWPLVALALYFCELRVVVVHFRRETHSFSLSEVAAVVGLFVLSPTDFVLAATLGPVLALVFPVRQTPVKFAFNAANFAVNAAAIVILFRLIAPHPGIAGPAVPLEWLAACLATMASTVISAFTIASAIELSGGAPQFQKIPEMLQFGGLVALANTSIALLAVSILRTDPPSIALLVAPLLAVFTAYRAYVSEREKKERLELIYRASRILQDSPAVDEALVALLDHARDMFRAELAEVVLLAGTPDEVPFRTTSRADGTAEVMVPAPSEPGDRLRAMMVAARGPFIYTAAEPGPVRQALVSPLVGEAGTLGLLWVANRIGEGSSFEADDLRLLETIANQVAVALENGQLEQSLAELTRLKDELRHQAFHDPLTGLGNRAMFLEALETRLGTPADEAHPTAVVYMDLDDFKVVNDTLGHQAGDDLLVHVAARIRACVRDTDVAARLGGDEFAILVDDRADMSSSFALATRIHDELSSSLLLGDQEVTVEASLGIAAAAHGSTGPDELLRNADVAMYTAKSEGKGRIAVYDPTMHAAIVARHALSGELARGVSKGQFELHFQPIVGLQDGRIEAVEALIRWNHPTRGLVRPDDFIKLAEENGAIIPIGRWVLLEACRHAAAWAASWAGPEPLAVSVNVSPRQLLLPEFVDDVLGTLARTGLDPRCLIVEVTETALLQETAATVGKLEILRSAGVRIALDDFGTGYSSLSYLLRLPVDILKIARDFVGGEGAADEGWIFANAILTLGRTLDLRVIAEGIETEVQLKQLRAMGCELGQGHLFGVPADGVTTTALLSGRTATAA